MIIPEFSNKPLLLKYLVVLYLVGITSSSSASSQQKRDSIINEVHKEVHEITSKEYLNLHFTHPWKYKVGDDISWKQSLYDDKDWKNISDENNQIDFSLDTLLNNVTGITWFRSAFDVDSSMVNKPLGLYCRQYGSAAEIYLDGKLLQSFGKVGTNIDSEKAQYGINHQPYAFILTSKGEHWFAVRFSSWHSKLLERQRGLELDVKDINNGEDDKKFVPFVFLMAVFLTLGVVHTILFFFIRSDKVNLFFGLYCIGIAFILFCLYYFSSSSDFEFMWYLTNASGYIAPLMMVPLIALYHTIYYRRLLRIFWLLIIIYLLYIGFDLFHLDSVAKILTALIIVFSIIEIFRVNLRAIIKKRDGAYILGLGILIIPAYIIIIVIARAIAHGGETHFDGGPFIGFLIILYVPLSITVYQARHFARINKTLTKQVEEIKALSEKTIEHEQERKRFLEEQNIRLEAKVAERTEELKQRQQQLIQSEKMASVGILTAGVAHEINNPINFVSANINPLKRDLSEIMSLLEVYSSLNHTNVSSKLDEVLKYRNQIDLNFTIEEIKSLISGIEEGSRRTADIVKGLRNFTRLDEEEKKKANINEGIESTLILLNSKLHRHHVEVEKSFSAIPPVECYPGQLNQVFMNLLTNAIDAIGSNVLQKPGERKIFISTASENNHVRISIRDTGAGMNNEVKKKLFDPFFTTKDVGKGTGLGLSISYGIIERHNGKIEVKSEEGKGTEFIVTLPV